MKKNEAPTRTTIVMYKQDIQRLDGARDVYNKHNQLRLSRSAFVTMLAEREANACSVEQHF